MTITPDLGQEHTACGWVKLNKWDPNLSPTNGLRQNAVIDEL